MLSKYVEMGTCKKPHGIKGGFDFYLYNNEQSSLKKGVEIKLSPLSSESSLPNDGAFFKIKSISIGNKNICYLEGIEDRNKVEEIIPFTISLDRENFNELPEDEIYLSDLENLAVLNEEKEKVGMVKTFYDHGATAVLVIELEDGQKVELPFVEAFFPEVNLEEEYVVMVNPEEI